MRCISLTEFRFSCISLSLTIKFKKLWSSEHVALFNIGIIFEKQHKLYSHLSTNFLDLSLRRPSQSLPSIKVHRIDTSLSGSGGTTMIFSIIFIAHPTRLPRSQRNKRLIRTQQGPLKRIAPIDTQPRTCHLHPSPHIPHQRQLARKNLTQRQQHHILPLPLQQPLYKGQGVRIALSAQRAQNKPPFPRSARGEDRLSPDGIERVVVEVFAR